jgi:replicative DNA helicase
VVIVDGAYLLGGIKYKNRWELVAENASFMKQVLATQLRVPVLASYEFTRTSMKDFKKKKNGEAPSLEDMAGSQEVPNLSSVALGVTDDTTPEGTQVRKIQVLKGRNGEVGSFYVSWDFKKMLFDEIEPEDEAIMDVE